MRHKKALSQINVQIKKGAFVFRWLLKKWKIYDLLITRWDRMSSYKIVGGKKKEKKKNQQSKAAKAHKLADFIPRHFFFSLSKVYKTKMLVRIKFQLTFLAHGRQRVIDKHLIMAVSWLQYLPELVMEVYSAVSPHLQSAC